MIRAPSGGPRFSPLRYSPTRRARSLSPTKENGRGFVYMRDSDSYLDFPSLSFNRCMLSMMKEDSVTVTRQ